MGGGRWSSSCFITLFPYSRQVHVEERPPTFSKNLLCWVLAVYAREEGNSAKIVLTKVRYAVRLRNESSVRGMESSWPVVVTVIGAALLALVVYILVERVRMRSRPETFAHVHQGEKNGAEIEDGREVGGVDAASDLAQKRRTDAASAEKAYELRIYTMKLFEALLRRAATDAEVDRYAALGTEKKVLAAVLRDYDLAPVAADATGDDPGSADAGARRNDGARDPPQTQDEWRALESGEDEDGGEGVPGAASTATDVLPGRGGVIPTDNVPTSAQYRTAAGLAPAPRYSGPRPRPRPRQLQDEYAFGESAGGGDNNVSAHEERPFVNAPAAAELGGGDTARDLVVFDPPEAPLHAALSVRPPPRAAYYSDSSEDSDDPYGHGGVRGAPEQRPSLGREDEDTTAAATARAVSAATKPDILRRLRSLGFEIARLYNDLRTLPVS